MIAKGIAWLHYFVVIAISPCRVYGLSLVVFFFLTVVKDYLVRNSIVKSQKFQTREYMENIWKHQMIHGHNWHNPFFPSIPDYDSWIAHKSHEIFHLFSIKKNKSPFICPMYFPYRPHMRISRSGGTPKWMIYKGKSQCKKWMITSGTHILGHPHIFHWFSIVKAKK